MAGHALRLRVLEFLLKQVIPIVDQENLFGDFAEMFDRISRRRGKAAAMAWYFFHIAKFVPSYFQNCMTWSLTMLQNYWKTALRHIKKYKAYSFINIGGLAIGMTCCILILLYVQDELSYDQYHEKADRIYRVVDSFDVPGGINADFALTCAPFAPTLEMEYQEVEDAVRIIHRRRMVAKGEKKYYEDGLFYADGSLFNIFTFPLIRGDPATALEAPNTVVVSENVALKYFGHDNVINEILEIDGQDFLVTGVMENPKENSHFYADIFPSLKTLEQVPLLQESYFQNWVRHEFYTYILLQEGASPDILQAKLPGFIDKHAALQVKTFLNGTLSSRLQPLTKIHLHSHLQAEIRPNSDIKYIYIFTAIALFTLLIACVNFMNLATARAANRTKEVGLRKVVGASRSQLVKQFLGESLLFTLFALCLAILLVVIALPSFNALAGKTIEVHDLSNVVLLGGMVLILFFVGITSGSYPAFFISRFEPGNVLKKSSGPAWRTSFMRKGLVVLQFAISIVLIISTAVVFNQLDFLRNRKLGFDKNHVVLVPIRADAIREGAEEIKVELMRNPGISSATIANAVPGGNAAGDVIRLVTDEGRETYTVRMIYTDHDYARTMGLEIVAGRDFAKGMTTDADTAFIINEAAVRELQLDGPLQVQVEYGFSETEVGKSGRIIGVVKDYQFQSLKEEITPLVIQIWPSSTRLFAIRIAPDNIQETLKFIENTWKKMDPSHPYEYSFMDETFDQLYKSEERLGQIAGIFSTLAIFIAAMGLFGLTLFTLEQRTKEIGVRKVLGASVADIYVLVSKEFALLVLFANLFAWPTAYFLTRKWLQSFAYRTDIGIGVFVLSAALALLIALATVSFQAIKAASANPTGSLRYE